MPILRDIQMTDTPPDRLSTNPRSPHFDMEKLQRGVGIRFKDRVRTDIEEYCISEGWVRVAAGKSRDRHGQPLTKSEEHTSELQSLMRISYAVFCLKKKKLQQ